MSPVETDMPIAALVDRVIERVTWVKDRISVVELANRDLELEIANVRAEAATAYERGFNEAIGLAVQMCQNVHHKGEDCLNIADRIAALVKP